MSAIEGDLLADCNMFSKPLKILNSIIENVKKAYIKAHIIHADLSEYNVLVTPKLKILIIDWPQWVSSNHPNWSAYLERDLKNILYYFERKFGIKEDLSSVIAKVTGTHSPGSAKKNPNESFPTPL
jgi:RIO kinase 2